MCLEGEKDDELSFYAEWESEKQTKKISTTNWQLCTASCRLPTSATPAAAAKNTDSQSDKTKWWQ